MSHVREALARLNAGITLVPRAFVSPPRVESRRMVEILQAADLKRDEPPREAMEALRRRVQAVFAGRDARPITRRELRDAAWLLWNGSPQGATIPRLLEQVFSAAKTSPRLVRSMIQAWLHDFVSDSATVKSGGFAIQNLLANSQAPQLQRWREAQRTFALFDPVHGPRRVAEAALTGQDNLADVWTGAGLDDPFQAVGGYMQAVLRQVLAAAPAVLRRPAGQQALDRLLDALTAEGKLRFGRDMRGEVGRALLGAWLDGGREPAPALRDTVRDFLLRHLGDPRLRAPDWTPVGEAGTALMRRWLARASLDAFFDLIADHALDYQWRYRQAFWSACLERGAIEDAWLALGHRVHSSARTLRDLAGAYGRLEGGGVAGDQSALLMRIGPLVLAEWSHNGKVRAWPADWQNAPRLYRATYGRDDLVGKGLPFPPNPQSGSGGSSDGMGLSHIGSDRGYWQGSVAELLARRTGIRLTEDDWAPR